MVYEGKEKFKGTELFAIKKIFKKYEPKKEEKYGFVFVFVLHKHDEELSWVSISSSPYLLTNTVHALQNLREVN